MYGIIGTAVVIGAISIFLIRKFNIKAIDGSEIKLNEKPFNKIGNISGGVIFGLGWALTGACPGPLYALVGSGFTIIIIALMSAALGVFCYGLIKDKLPH
tara:strand:- start:57 stop:356 length:300 start_codon:yes stop_codon:yes gene_type:complete